MALTRLRSSLSRSRRGQLAVFDLVLLVPLLTLTVVVVSIASESSSVSSSALALEGTQARETLAAWLSATVRETNVSYMGGLLPLYAPTISSLVQQMPTWSACDGDSSATLSQYGEAGSAALGALQALSRPSFTEAAFTVQGGACGTQVFLSFGPSAPVGASTVFTAYTRESGTLPNGSGVSVGVLLWNP